MKKHIHKATNSFFSSKEPKHSSNSKIAFQPFQIGKLTIHNPIALAPMAGVSDYPFRAVCRDYGCQLAYSEMVSSEGLVRGTEKSMQYLYKGEEEKHSKERISNKAITGFQIFGSDPEVMADAAVILQEKGADIVDINMGCPVKKVTRNNAGSALMGDTDLLRRVATAVRKKVTVPFTVKIRAGFQTQINAVEVSRILEDCGVDAIIVHPRTQKQAFSGHAAWDIIRDVKKAVQIPVIGNGDVFTIEDYREIRERTQCDAVMLGRGTMGRPWIFHTFIEQNFSPSLNQVKETLLKQYQLSLKFYGETKALREMRKHFSWYSKGFSKSNEFRATLYGLSSFEEVKEALHRFFSLQEYNNKVNTEENNKQEEKKFSFSSYFSSY